jgi:hypothetical protein
MTTATETMEMARPLAAALVERMERQFGSRMAAYERVASVVGVSPSWLRKLLGRQPGLTLEAHEFFNIASAYRSLCARIEGEAEREKRRYLELGREAHAAVEGALQLAPLAIEAGQTRAPDETAGC